MASLNDLEDLGPYKPEVRKKKLDSLEYVRDIPTVGGYATEAVREIVREAPKAAIASPLKGLAALAYQNQEQATKEVLTPVIRSSLSKLTDPNKRKEAISELKSYRNIPYYGASADQKKAIDDIISRAEKGETDPAKFLEQFEQIKPKPIEERAAYKVGKGFEKILDENLKRTPGYEDSTMLDVAGAVGSTAGSVAQALVLGPSGLVVTSALQGVDEQLTRAKQSGLSDDEAAKFAVQGAGPGAIGMLSIEYLLRKVPPVARKELFRIAADVAKSGAAEGITEALQQVLQNGIEMQYNKDRGLLDGTLYEGVLGGSASMVLRGVVLGATRGKGVGVGGKQPDPESVKRELAEEELRIRQRENAKAGKEQAPEAKTPAEAAKQGQTEAVGEPATVTWTGTGESFKGTIRKRTADGGYEVVDQDGTVTIINQADIVGDPETGAPPLFKVETGWKNKKADEKIEKELEEWLKAENPWPKVTVETEDGVKFKAIRGPDASDGYVNVRDATGSLMDFDPGSIKISDGWDPDAVETPAPPLWERDTAKKQADVVTKEDDESPIPNDLIRAGRALQGEAEGTEKANEILKDAGVPPVGTKVQYEGDDGQEEAVIDDAASDSVKLLTNFGEIIEGKIAQIAPKIRVIPVERANELDTAWKDYNSVAPKGRVTSKIEKGLSRRDFESEYTAFFDKNPEVFRQGPTEEDVEKIVREQTTYGGQNERQVRENLEPETVQTRGGPEGDNRERQREGETGIGQGEDVRNATQYEARALEATYPGVHDTEVQRAPEERQVVEPQAQAQPLPEISAGGINARNTEAETQQESQGGVQSQRQREIKVPYAQRRGTEGENVEGQVRPQGVAPIGQVETKTEASAPQPIKQAPEPISDAAKWWESASETDRRSAVVKAGFSEPGIAGRSLRASRQGQKYASMAWDDVPQAAKEAIRTRNEESISSFSKALSSLEPEVKPLTKTLRRPIKQPVIEKESKPALIPTQTVSQAGLEYRKNGKPFDSESAALMTVSKQTHEAVKVDGGWARRLKGAVTEAETKPVAQEPKTKSVSRKKAVSKEEAKLEVAPKPVEPTPETSVEKATPVKRVSTKKYQEARAKINDELRQELDRIGLKDVKLDTPDKISEVEGKKLIEDSKVSVGRTTGNLIEVALEPERDYRKTLRHEALHAMRNLGLFTNPEWRTLERDVKSDRSLMDDVKERYAGESLTEESLIEEAIADKFADYSEGLSNPKGFIKSAFEKIKNFLKAFGNALRGNGFRTASDIFQSIERGEIGARQRQIAQRTESKLQIQRVESEADKAMKDLVDPSAGLVDEDMQSRILKGDEFFVNDLGWLKKFTISPRTIASLTNHFAPIYAIAKHQYGFRDKIINDLGMTYKPYQSLKKDSKKKVNKVLELGRLEQEVYDPDSNGTITVTSNKRTATMQAGETVILNPEEVAAYKSVRSMMDQALKIFQDQTVRDFGFDPKIVGSSKEALSLITPKTPPSVRDKIQTLAKMMNDIEQSKKTGYIPFTRFGNVVVVAKRINANTGQYETLHSETVEVKGLTGYIKKQIAGGKLDNYPEIKSLKEDLSKRYPGSDVRAFEVASREDVRPETDRDMLTELLQLPPDQVASAVQKMHTEAIAKGFRKHFFGARNVPGYSSDIERSIADYVIGLGGYTSRRTFYGQWVQAISAIPSNMPKLKAYANQYREYINSPKEEFAALRQAGFIYFLAGNISNAAVNLTQVPLVAAPYLTMFDNSAKVSLEIGRAYKDAIKMLGGEKKNIFNPSKAPPDVRAALEQAWAEGQFTPLAMFDIMGVAYNRRENMRSLSAKTREALEYVAIFQTGSERINRVVTFIAAYRLANKDPKAFRQKAFNVLKDNALASNSVLLDFSPEKFASYIVDETQYDVGKLNRAVGMRGVGAAIFQFKSFLANTLELHYRLGTIHGNKGVKALALMWSGLIATGGLWAITLAEDVADLTELIYKWWTGIDIDTRTATRETMVELTGSPKIAEMITNGSSRALGLDLTSRVGLGKVLPRTTEEAGGIPVSLVYGKGSQAVTNFKDGKILEGFTDIMPLFMKNPFTAYQWYNNGIRTRYGDPVFLPDEITAGDVAAKTIGFTPSKVAERRAMEWAQQRATKTTQDMKTKYYRRMARAISEGDKAAATGDDVEFNKQYDKLYDIIDEINAKNEEAIEREQYHKVFEINDRSLMKRILAEEIGKGLAKETTAPVVTRPRMQELREIFGDTR